MVICTAHTWSPQRRRCCSLRLEIDEPTWILSGPGEREKERAKKEKVKGADPGFGGPRRAFVVVTLK